MVEALENRLGRTLQDGEQFVLTVSGRFKEEFGGELFQARDIVRIIRKGKK